MKTCTQNCAAGFIRITDAVQSFATVFLKLTPVAPVFLSSQQPAIKETQTY